MKAIRWTIGFFWIWIFTFIVDFVFFNYFFDNQLMMSGLARPVNQLKSFMPLMLGAELLFAIFFTYYYFKMYRDGKLQILRGLNFGFWIGFFVFGWRALWAFYIFNWMNHLVWWMLVLGWIECIIAGVGIGVIGWVIPNLFKSAIKNAQAEAAATPAATAAASAKPEKAQAPSTKADPEPKSGGDDGDAT